MASLTKEIELMIAGLKQARDELNVQMHLAKSEAREEWNDLEKNWQDLRGRLDRIAAEAGTASSDVLEAVKLVGEEIQKGYSRLRKHL